MHRSTHRSIRSTLLGGVALGLVASGVHADVTPDQVVTAAQKESIRGLIPDEIYPYVAEDYEDLEMKIVAAGDYTPHPKYVEATVKFACQATLDERGVLRNYTAGQPFPYSEWAKQATNHACDLTEADPQFALKLAWNVNYRWQGGTGHNLPHWGFSNMRNRGKETWRIAEGEYRRTYFSHRADLLPATHQLEDGTDIEWAEFFDVKTPFDLRGTMFLLYRYTTDKEDDTWAYIPALRRVRRIAATQKSDSLLGTEFALEDFYIFSGYVWDHQWEFKGESQKLAPMNSTRLCFPSVIGEDERQRKTGQTRLGTEKEWETCPFGPYRALAFRGENWEKRSVVQIDDVPRQKGHPYSRKMIWYDKETLTPVYGMMYDRAGKPFKIINHILKWSEDTGNPYNQGVRSPIINYVMIANVQNDNSHVGQFDNTNIYAFEMAESRNYYDTTKLKRMGR